MRQPHKNLFLYYRGALPKNDRSDFAFDRQLEDNATKALLYVLEHANRSQVLQPFLKNIVGIRSKLRVDEIQFALQRVDISRPLIKQRYALSIAPIEKLKASDDQEHRSGRPDAWIWSEENSFAILLETKVHGQVSIAQLRRHVRSVEGWTWKKVKLKPCSWSDIYGFFQDVLRRRSKFDSVTCLLLDEFVRYMRMTGLSSMTTFDLEDFGYFMTPPEDRQETHRELLKRKLSRFAAELSSSKAMRQVVQYYSGKYADPKKFVHPGVFRKDGKSYWITVGLKERRSRCHFTVRITEEGIALEVFSPHKSFTEKLVKKIKTKPDEFIASLRPMKRKESYIIRLREAYYHDPSSPYKGQRISKGVDFMEIHPRAVKKDNLAKIITEPLEEHLRMHQLRPEIFLVRNFRLSEMVGNSDVVNMVASAAAPMMKYLDFALKLEVN